MNEQPFLFDIHDEPLVSTGEALKDAGMQAAADHRREELEQARAIARQVALQGDGTCDMDRVRALLPEHVDLGPAAGSVFQGKEWADTGVRIRSTLPANHARELRVWKLNSEEGENGN